MKSCNCAPFFAVLLCAALSGCSKPGPDFQALGDAQITEQYLRGYHRQDAVEFITNGGRYADSDDPTEPKIDQSHVLPLLTQLRDEFGFEWIAAIDRDVDEQMAEGVFASIPEDVSRSAVKERISDYSSNHAGHVIQQWGYEYLLLDFLSAEDLEALPNLKAKLQK